MDNSSEYETECCLKNIIIDECNINDLSKIDTTGKSNSNHLLLSQSPRGRVKECQSISNLQDECSKWKWDYYITIDHFL